MNLQQATRSLFLLLFFLQTLLQPFAPDQAQASFSVSEEKETGEKLLSLVRQQFTLLDDPDISQYVNGLGKEILVAAGPQFFDFHFFVIADKEFNAFAAPSGLIFVHSGLIEAMDDEGELYGVLAHEIGHVASRHIAEQMEQNTKISLGTAVLMLAGIALGTGPLGEAVITGGLAAGQSMALHFSRKDEEEADRLAYTWMEKNNRDPHEIVSMMQKMVRISKYRGGNLPQYLLTHPEPDRRVGYVQDLLSLDAGRKYRKISDIPFQRIKARVLSLTKEPTLLQTKYLKIKNNNDPTAMADYGLSLVYLANAQYDKAIEAIDTVIAKYPNMPIFLTDKGFIYFQQGEPQKALSLFQEAHRRDRDDLYTVYNLARTYEQLGRKDDAVVLYEQLIEQQPDFAKAYMQLGQLKAKDKEEGKAYYYLGLYYWLSGDEKNALSSLKKSVSKAGSNQALQIKAQNQIDMIERLQKKF